MLRILTFATLLALCSACSDPAPATHVADLRLAQEGENFPVLSGALVNSSERPVSSAEVVIDLLDVNNMIIENAEVRIQLRDIAPGDSAFFRRPLDLYPAGARVKSVIAN